MDRLTKDPAIPKRVIAALDTLEKAAGGRLAIIETMTLSNLTPQQEHLTGLIADPRNDAKSLARICSMANITVGKFLTMLGEIKMSKAVLDAQDRVARLLPDVAEDVMQRSVVHTIECSECAGEGSIPVTSRGRNAGEGSPPEERTTLTCPGCRGKGNITVQPHLEHQKVALELSGMIKRGGGVQVAVGVNAGITPALTSSATFRGATDKLMFGRRQSEPVDAEVVEKESEE